MKTEPRVKKLMLRKETLRDLTAQNAGQVKGGEKRSFFCTKWATACLFFTCKCHGNTRKPCGH